MKTATSCALIGAAFLAGAIAATSVDTATAHISGISRLDIQNAMREAMRSNNKAPLTTAELETTVRRVLSKCRFIGSNVAKDTADADSTDFQGRIAC